MKLTVIPDNLNKVHHHVYLNKFEIGSIHCPWPNLKPVYSVYTTDDRTKLLTFNTYEECVKYIEDYIDG